MKGALIVLGTLAVSAWLTRRLADPASPIRVLDQPNPRSLHVRPVPRTGGLAIVTAFLLGATLLIGDEGKFESFFAAAAALLLIAAVSFWDDWHGLGVADRLLAQLAAAGLLLLDGFYVTHFEWPGSVWTLSPWLGVAVSAVFIVWMINLYNFMDGMDGFAGGMAVIGFGCFALMGAMAHQPLFFYLNLVVVASAAGFLLFNFPPARIFMGDVGSSSLGLLAAAMSIWGARLHVFPFWVALLVFSPFIVDASVTLLRRLLRRERVWEAHKTHYYQRLVQRGWGHHKTTLSEYGLMLACAGAAVYAVRATAEAQWIVIATGSACYVFIMMMVDKMDKKKADAEAAP